jgi:hypothetical protein
MDCRTARLLLEFQRPCAGELPADDEAELKDHLGSCPECGAASSTERRLDDYFGRAVREVSVPDNLRERLLGRLKEERSAALRRKLAWTARGVAVAATLLIGVFAWWYWIGSKPPHLDPETALYDDLGNYNARSAEEVQDWFRDRKHVTMLAPREFDYSYLTWCGMAPLQGKEVPLLIFQRTEDAITRARVFVLAADQFDVGNLRIELANIPPAEPNKEPVIESVGRKLVLHDSAEAPGTAYVIIFDGDDLKPLHGPPPDVK